MLGHLVPCSGGKPIALARSRLYLGRRRDADSAAPLSRETALCRLRYIDGWWQIETLHDAAGVRVNGKRFDSRRLEPHDELAFGRSRYRIVYDRAEDAGEALERLAESVLLGDGDAVSVSTTAPLDAAASDDRSVTAEDESTAADDRSSTAVDDRAATATGSGAAAAVERPAGTAADDSVMDREFSGEVLGRLIPLGGGHDIPLLKPRLTIGRKSSCDIALRHATVSSLHCGLQLLDGYWKVTDLGSRNGTRVDHAQCTSSWLYPDSRLSIGGHRFRIEYTPQGEPPLRESAETVGGPSLMARIGLKDRDLDRVAATHPDEEPDSSSRRYNLLEEL